MSTFCDQMNFDIDLKSDPQRIISLVPSQTELLFDLGLEHRIVGVTKFCVHPRSAKTKIAIGGTKNFNFDIIDQLQPDLIIGNKEENYEEGIVQLRKKYPVWMSDIFSLEDAISMIGAVGQLTSVATESEKIIHSIEAKFSTLKKFSAQRVLYMIWRKPWMGAGRNTFINSMLIEAGWKNCLDTDRYPVLTDQQIAELSPELIFLSSEPYPFKEKHIEELYSLVPSAKIILVDGEMFSWYGSRLINVPAYFDSLRVQLS